MIRILSTLYISFISFAGFAQVKQLSLDLSQDIYFAGDSIYFVLSSNTEVSTGLTVNISMIDNAGKTVENYYTTIKEHTQLGFFKSDRSLKSDWYYIQAASSDGLINSNIIRFFILNADDSKIKFNSLSSEFYLFPEGNGKIVYGLNNRIFVKKGNLVSGDDDLIILRQKDGKILDSNKADEDGFAELEFIPETSHAYEIEIRNKGKLLVRKTVDQSLFSNDGILLAAKIIDKSKVNISLYRHERNNQDLVLFIASKSNILERRRVIEDNQLLDLRNYPSGLISLSLRDLEGNRLAERLLYNEVSIEENVLNEISGIPDTLNRSEEINLSVDLDEKFLDKSASVILSVKDQNLNLFVNKNANTQFIKDVLSMKFFFSELITKLNDTTRSKSSLDRYFAINKLPMTSLDHSSTNQASKQNTKIILEGTLYDSLKNPVKNTSVILSIPRVENSFTWTVTDEFGRFKFDQLDFSGNEFIYITPKFNSPNTPYSINIQPLETTADINGYQNFISENKLHLLSRNLNIKKNIKLTYTGDSQEGDRSTYKANQTSAGIFSNADYDLDLETFELPQEMKKMINAIIPGINVRRGKLRVFSAQYGRQFNNEPLVLIDGVPFFDIDSLLSIDPVRFKRVQLISTINKLIPYGNIGNSGIIAFYTIDGYEIQDNYAHKLYATGYRELGDSKEVFTPKNSPRTPYLEGNYLYKIYNKNELDNTLNISFKTPDIQTTLLITLKYTNTKGEKTISKVVYVKK